MKCSRLTHGHPRSQLACAFFVEVAAALVRGISLPMALVAAQKTMAPIITDGFPAEREIFARILSPQLESRSESEISGSGYVIDCLEARLWCALQAKSYRDGVLRAVNLGDDTDTTGAVAGAFWGCILTAISIPKDWRQQLARVTDISVLCDRFQQVCQQRWESNQ